MFEELIERKGLEIALANRSESELEELLKFILWKVSDYKFQSIIIEVTRMILDMYMGVFAGFSKRIDSLIMQELKGKVENEIELISSLNEMQGMIDNVMIVANIMRQS